MTHTVTDAEAAIARHPESLEQLSIAADLLIELGDPRGEDFAACLVGTITAEEVMRRHPACRCAMFVAALVMESKAFRCRICRGTGRVYVYMGHGGFRDDECWECTDGIETGVAFVARAEALRLLAECGKVGSIHPPDPNWFFYWSIMDAYPHELISGEWWEAARELGKSFLEGDAVSARLDLLDAYAKADPDTRRRWAEETRALAPREETVP